MERKGSAKAQSARSFSPSTTPKSSALRAGTQSRSQTGPTPTWTHGTASHGSQRKHGVPAYPPPRTCDQQQGLVAPAPSRPSSSRLGGFLRVSLDNTAGLLYTTDMTETTSSLIEEIEAFLALTASRDVFTSTEIQDLLLDLRTLANPNLN